MSKYDIYELMGEYADEEFAPEKDSNIDVKDVRKRVSKHIKMPHRSIKLKAALALAAVTAAVCTGAAISAFPNGNDVTMYVDMLTKKDIKLTFGYNEYGETFEEDDGAAYDVIFPLELVEDRLWFVADGQNFDITDMIDMDTGYIYKTVNPGTGLADWVIVGGTPECYGFYEIMKYGDARDENCDCDVEFCYHCGQVIDSGGIFSCVDIYIIDGEAIPAYEMTEEEIQRAEEMVEAGEAVLQVKSLPWLVSVGDEFNYPSWTFDEDFIMYSSEW